MTVTINLIPAGPIVVTVPGAAEITQTSAKVGGTVNPNEANVTECKVEYGTDTNYGLEEQCESLPGEGNSPVGVAAPLSGLTANTTYHFRVVATNANGTSEGEDQTFSTLPNAPAVTTTAGATEITTNSAKVAGTVNPEGALTSCVVEYGESTAYGSEAFCSSSVGSGTSPVGVEAALVGLNPNTTHHFRVVATNAGGTTNGSDQEFTTEAIVAPVVTTEAATAITKTTATLNATVNPKGGEVTDCHFDYGLSVPGYGSTAPCVPAPGDGSSPVAVSAAISDLAANTTYHFRVVATNSAGATNGGDLTFTTASTTSPTVTTTPGASPLAQTTATVAGTVNPNGENVTECKVQYGTDTSYGSTKDCASLPGTGASPVGVEAALSGLSPNTTYHFRFLATNADGTTNGSDQEFTTSPNAPLVTTTAGATEVTQTSAKVAGTVNPEGGNVTECKVQYGIDTSYGSSKDCASLPDSGTSPVGVEAALSGLVANTTYHFRVVATNAGGTTNGSDQTFSTLANAPTVTTTPGATQISSEGAKVAGTVNPNGAAVSECKIEYGTTASYGSSEDCASLPGSGTSPVVVNAVLSGLAQKTVYHFRVVATNAGGTGNGVDRTFTTLVGAPSVITTPGATEITQTSAKLAGTVNPNAGNVTACKVEYGASASYGAEKACASLPGAGSSAVEVSAVLNGLSPNTTYHFRVVATNAGGTTNGSDQTFTTLANTCQTDASLCPPPPTPAPAPPTPSPTPTSTPKPLKCKKGFKKKKVRGKAKCVKVRANKHGKR